MAPKDHDHITKKSGIIYRYKCDRLECDHEYIGETARTFGDRFKEHLKAPPLYLTIVTSQVIQPLLITSQWWAGKSKTSPGWLKNLCS